MRHMIVGTAGHIDHGKSALVKALTGTDPDRLKEEQLRGITIDLGFAHLDLGDVQIGLVDVPGHEKFVKNMLAGVGGIDCVLLVVAADESVMPQTREHFDICRLLGISHGLVAITKTDLADPEMVELVREEVSDLVGGSFLEGAAIVPVSSKTGDGIEQIRESLKRLAGQVPARPANRLPRLPVDRAFSIRGFGTVVTGTLISGILKKEDEVELIPGELTSKVRGMQVHGTRSDLAVAGQRTAVNLQGIDLGKVKRGMVVTVPRVFHPTQLLDVRLTLLASARPLRNFLKVRFHAGTSEIMARVALMGRDVLAPGETVYAQLRLDAPVFCLYSDPFIIRQFSPAVTIGGGRIVDPHPMKHRVTDKKALADLKLLDNGGLPEKLPVFIRQRGSSITLRELNSSLGMPEPELESLCRNLAAAGKLVLVAGSVPTLLTSDKVRVLEEKTVALVSNFHDQNPLIKGISREELRKRIFDDVSFDVFRFCLEDLVGTGRISLHDDMVSLPGRRVLLSPHETEVRKLIENVLLQSGFQPPALSELADAIPAEREEVRRIALWMIREKILIKISDEIAYHSATLEEIKKRLSERHDKGAKFGVAEFKDLLGLTRKHAIPLLEFLDRERFTQRRGNERILL